MSTTISVVCYKSKVLKNNESPLMIRICKDRKMKYESIGISLDPEEILAWIELLKIKAIQSKRFSPNNFLKKARREYGLHNSALMYLDAYISFFLENDIVKTKEKLTRALEVDPHMIDEIQDELLIMLENDEIKGLIEQMRIQQKI